MLGTTTTGYRPITFHLAYSFEKIFAESARKQFAFHRANWTLNKSDLNRLLQQRKPQEVSYEADLIDYNKFLTDCINQAPDRAIPSAASFVRTNQVKASMNTLDLIKRKHHLYHQMRKEENNLHLRDEFNRYRLLVKNALLNDRKKSFLALMKKLSGSSIQTSKMWSTVNRFKNNQIQRDFKHKLKFNDKTASFDQEKAELFRSYFAPVYDRRSNKCQQHFEIDQIASEETNRLKQTKSFECPKISLQELKFIIVSLGNTAVGHDGIHNRCLKNGTKLLFQHLVKIYYSSLSIGFIPEAWKLGHVVLLPKPEKNPHEVQSYRPITLLSCLGKLIERIIKHRLTLFAESHNLLLNNQAGFRKGRCTNDNLLHLTHDVSSNLHQSRKVALVVFDIKQAFDSVWHNGLLFKLKQMRTPDYLWQWCKQFLNGRTSLIELNSSISDTFELRRGNPQGSPLSPLLYILYTSDSLLSIPNHTISNLFADDTVLCLWSSAPTTRRLQIRLQESIDAFSSWCHMWKLELQGERTKLIRFTNHSRKKYPPLDLFVNNSEVKETDFLKYLGCLSTKVSLSTNIPMTLERGPVLGLVS